MGRASIKEMVSGAGLPCVHMAWREGMAPKLPWCVFYIDETNGFFSDDGMDTKVNRWVVELYQEQSDTAVESALEKAISERFGGYLKTESWIDTENCIQSSYYFTEIE